MKASRPPAIAVRGFRAIPLALMLTAITALGAEAAVAPRASAEPAETADAPRSELTEATACPVEIPDAHRDRVECGVLIVPESRAADAQEVRMLRLPFAVIASAAAAPREDPIVVPTAGGPGAGTLTSISHFLEDAAWMSRDRDVILLEQRGDGLADPSLACPELDVSTAVFSGVLLAGADAQETRLAGIQQCRDRLAADGIDLAQYTSSASASDLADLRTALGYEDWNLYAVAYGSRIALTLMRDQAEGLRAAVLDSPYPPNIDVLEQAPGDLQAAIDRVIDTCVLDAACADAYPDLAGSLDAVFGQATADPLEVLVDLPSGAPVAVVLDHDAVAGLLMRALLSATDLTAVPFLVDRLERGDADAAVPFVQEAIDAWDLSADGLRMSVQCAEEVPFNDPAAVAEANAAIGVASGPGGSGADPFADCAVWQVPALGVDENAAVDSDVPTFIAVGAYDPTTTTAWAEAAATGLTNATVAVSPRLSHAPVWNQQTDGCAADIARRFLDDPGAPLDTSCIEDAPAVEYLTTADIDPTSALYRAGRDLFRQLDPVQLGIALSTIVLMLATLVYGLVVAIRTRVRLSGDIPSGTVFAAVSAAGFDLAYGAVLVALWVLSDPALIAFGVPAWTWPLMLLPVGGLVATILLIALLVRAWLRDDGTLAHRVALSVSAAASAVFLTWLLARGLWML